MSKEEFFHEPVLLPQAIDALKVEVGKRYIDATLGGGGHAAEVVKRGGVVLGIDVDPAAVSQVRSRGLPNLTAVRGNFVKLGTLAKSAAFVRVSGVLFDLGMSSFQLERSGRGFSFLRDEPLDMRMDPELKVRARDLVNALGKNELSLLFEKYGEEPLARLYSAAIVRARKLKPIETSLELAQIIEREYTARAGRKGRIHPATRVFQALRVAVNDELENLKGGLAEAVGLLEPKGRLVVISFHSLEDRIVKGLRREESLRQVGGLVRPSKEEVSKNPRASSARMRVYEKK